MKRIYLIAIMAVLSCKTTAPPVPDNPGTADELDEWIVWTRGEDGTLRTLIIAETGGADARLVGAGNGAWVGTEEGGWNFTHVDHTVKRRSCECELAAEPARDSDACTEPVHVSVGVWRAHPRQRVIATGAPEELSEYISGLAVSLEGTVGPFAFITLCEETFACGAHPNQTCRQRIVDLRDVSEVSAAAVVDTMPSTQEMLGIVREAYEDEQEAEDIAPDAVSLTHVAPLYESGALPHVEEQYTGPACYACSDGLWDSYTVSTRRTVDQFGGPVAAWLADNDAPPQAVWSLADAVVGGWSKMPRQKLLRAALRDAILVSDAHSSVRN